MTSETSKFVRNLTFRKCHYSNSSFEWKYHCTPQWSFDIFSPFRSFDQYVPGNSISEHLETGRSEVRHSSSVRFLWATLFECKSCSFLFRHSDKLIACFTSTAIETEPSGLRSVERSAAWLRLPCAWKISEALASHGWVYVTGRRWSVIESRNQIHFYHWLFPIH